jgi:hypothetical protein
MWVYLSLSVVHIGPKEIFKQSFGYYNQHRVAFCWRTYTRTSSLCAFESVCFLSKLFENSKIPSIVSARLELLSEFNFSLS